ncbi:MAG TPA: hypothetical protein VFO34_06725 [Candidatus Acidoferrales bacterium]|nr:hypothetical protein [Candidatus Acidoferrales bacterium]
MHWFFTADHSESAGFPLHVVRVMSGWLPVVINSLLTAAIAYAGYRQYVVAQKLFDLQNAIETQKNKVSLFLRIKVRERDNVHGLRSAVVEVSNLSPFGIWLESLTIFETEHNTRNIQVEDVLAAGATFRYLIRDEIVKLCGITSNDQKASAVISAIVNYTTSEKNESAETPRYRVTVGSYEVQSLFLDEGKSLERRT